MKSSLYGQEPDKTIEASQLGWEPGYFPMVCKLGQILREKADEKGVIYVDYVNPSKGEVIRVIND